MDILKYKNININNLNISDFNIDYNSKSFLIQCPIFNDYKIINYNDKKYIELNFNETKSSHLNFLTLIDSIELKINNTINKSIKTQIITNIQNKKSLKVKLLDDTIFYNSNKEVVTQLYSNKISLLLKLEFYNYYYSWVVVQILQLS